MPETQFSVEPALDSRVVVIEFWQGFIDYSLNCQINTYCNYQGYLQVINDHNYGKTKLQVEVAVN